jgi:hypothetical protein
MIENAISVHEFSPDALVALVCGDGPSRGDPVPDQVTYLARYCKRLGVQTLVREKRYMDRHYVDEYAFYYSRMLTPPPSAVERIHLFAKSFSEQAFAELLERSLRSAEERRRVEEELMASPGTVGERRGYLGYLSVRPIPSVPIGRTIVARLKDEQQPRNIWALNSHAVHLGSLHLHVEGLAFQQQDAAVGACATAALWSALVRIARQDGMRAPTPAEISEAATRAARSPVRPMLSASTGLTVQQLCEATRAFGFAPEVFSPRTRPEAFVAALHTYLLSGMPVVLALRGGGVGHAVTAVGFQMTGSEHPRLQGSVPVRSAEMTKLYVHDDRLGPYARANIEPFAHPELGEGLVFEIEWEGRTQRWVLDTAIAAVYPKLRLTVRSLVTLAELVGAAVEDVVGADSALRLRVDFRYERAGDYLARLSGRVRDPRTGADFVRRVALSRWCAIMRWWLGPSELVEFVYDTTDVVRRAAIQNRELLRAVVCLSPTFDREAAMLAEAFDVLAA